MASTNGTPTRLHSCPAPPGSPVHHHAWLADLHPHPALPLSPCSSDKRLHLRPQASLKAQQRMRTAVLAPFVAPASPPWLSSLHDRHWPSATFLYVLDAHIASSGAVLHLHFSTAGSSLASHHVAAVTGCSYDALTVTFTVALPPPLIKSAGQIRLS
jgi:hypothetical protein